MVAAPARKLWAGFSGVVLALILIAAGMGYAAPEPAKSPWILALAAALFLGGAVLLTRSVRKLRHGGHGGTDVG
ncbi:hypothetical protein [Kitasatospora purpeofusca]|uniref:hypothetical protein n=1 Tax=Kitasatospora purpeofusca TaxID=67352 RepID=UPI002A5AEB17|nr:hypothetical protein [Kitasatospora purpeofusca]MDY0811073.1 hypothetical protein [Kitasatospora purpeofusca]